MDDLTLRQARLRLLRWYRRCRRDLPWRRTHDPYRIWVSEIMLQQTRVDVVVPYYERFLRRFPTVASLARAAPDAVLRAWSGLGYYGRARHLHAAAQCVVAEHAGQIPHDVESLRALPGIGPYTAGAIASLAFGQQAPVLDGNVQRVFARLLAWEQPADTAASRRRLWELASRWARSRSPGEVNQALMELGATRCQPAAPRCSHCPLRPYCRAYALGTPTDFPRHRRRVPLRDFPMAAVVLRCGSAWLLVRRCSGRLLRHWWEVPSLRLAPGQSAAAVRRDFRQRAGFDCGPLKKISRPSQPALRHGILSHRIDIEIFQGQLLRRRLPRRPHTENVASRGNTPLANLELQHLEWRWITPMAQRTLPVSTLARKVMAAVASTGEEEGSQSRRHEKAAQRRRHPTEQDVP